MIPIPGFENYVISENGTVTNLNTGRVLKPSLNENGYLYVALWKENKQRSQTLHRLVATAYLPNPLYKPIVNHKDADRTNPHKDNLEWCTQSENVAHAYRLGNMSAKRNFSEPDLDWLLAEVLANRNMTDLAETMKVGLSRLTINLRKRAIDTGQSGAFCAILKEQKRVRNTAANSGRRKPVNQLDEQGNVFARFPSATAAARALGKTTAGPIYNALNPDNPQQRGYGYQWKYA